MMAEGESATAAIHRGGVMSLAERTAARGRRGCFPQRQWQQEGGGAVAVVCREGRGQEAGDAGGIVCVEDGRGREGVLWEFYVERTAGEVRVCCH